MLPVKYKDKEERVAYSTELADLWRWLNPDSKSSVGGKRDHTHRDL